MTTRRYQDVLKGFKRALRGLKIATWPNLGASWNPWGSPNPVKTNGFCMFLLLHRFASEDAPDGPKRLQERPKRTQDEPKEGARRPQVASKWAPSRFQKSPSRFQKSSYVKAAPKRRPRGPKSPQEAPKRLPRAPRRPPRGPREGPQEASKRPPRSEHLLSRSRETSRSPTHHTAYKQYIRTYQEP